jgi:hypothetical protein
MLMKCAYCDGRGRDRRRGSKGGACPVCDGLGQISVPDNHVKCGRCRGHGGHYERHGFIREEFSKSICPACHGTGVGTPVEYG